jgi:hypothetical protein
MSTYRPETKVTGRPRHATKLTAAQRRELERREAQEASETQRRLKAEALERMSRRAA